MQEEIAQTITIPEGIELNIENKTITVKTDKAKLKKTFDNYRIQFEKKENKISVIGKPINKQTRALLNTIVAHIKNMIKGTKFGFKYTLEISYSHFPMTAEVKDKEFVINNFLGEKFPRTAKIVGNTKVEVKGQEVTISGYNLEEVSQTAANISLKTKVKGKDIRRFTDGIYLSKKEPLNEIPEEFEIEIVRGRE